MGSPLQYPSLAVKRWALINSGRLCCGETAHHQPANQSGPQLSLSSLPLTYIECAAEHHCALALLLVSLLRMKIKYIPKG